jgi:hypothetical protein
MMAIGVGLMAIVGLMFLTLGLFAYVILAGLLLFTVAAVQYVHWGHWLEKRVREEVEEEERLEREQSARDAVVGMSSHPGEKRSAEVTPPIN